MGDLHINSTLGLCPALVRLDEGGAYQPSPFQRKLWECWLDFWEQVRGECARGERLAVVVNGDLVDGDHHRTTQIISSNLETQTKAALDVLEPVRKLADVLYIVRGTEVHAGQGAQDEEAIARTLGGVRSPTGAFSFWRLIVDLGGVRFDFAHHGPMGRLPWTSAGLLIRHAVTLELMYHRIGQALPAYAVRSHNHRWGDTGMNTPVRVLALPCWCGISAYTHKVTQGELVLPQVGGVIFRVEGGQHSFRMVNYSEQTAWVS